MNAGEPIQRSGLGERLDAAIARATAALLARQYPGGHWQGVVEAAANLEAEYLFVNRLVGRERPEEEARMAERLLGTQGADGGWALAPGQPAHLSTTIEAYLALKLAGVTAAAPELVRAREAILGAGGLARAGMFTRFWLACFGQFPWSAVPRVPVEMILLPPWAPMNVSRLASWTRATLVPFSLLMAHPPEQRAPPEADVQELWLREPTPADLSFGRSPSLVSWRNLFLGLDRTLAALGRVPWRPMRRRAVARAIEWVLRHENTSGQWAGIQPAIVQSVLALHAIGFAKDHPAMVRGLQGLDDLLVQRGAGLVCQPCVMPVLDTATAMRALLDAGLPPDHPALARGGEWLMARQIFRAGDWTVRVPGLDPGGWAAQPGNDFYPNVGVSALVLSVLQDLPLATAPSGRHALAHGIAWTLGMQSRGGGWAAFDADNDSRALAAVPFPDLEGVTDPSCADTTGWVLEAAAAHGFAGTYGRLRRATDFLARLQHDDGSWTGRWGVNALHGTWRAIAGMVAVGEEPHAPIIRRAVDWLVARQNGDGGWGERVSSYDDPSLRGVGESTPAQTAWAVLALLAARGAEHPAVAAGVDHLLRTQRDDGTWAGDAYTTTGVPGRSYLRLELASLYEPLRALGQVRAHLASRP
jgi:squalene-hopene/tetraprenyl-beta-curcumene cyclase